MIPLLRLRIPRTKISASLLPNRKQLRAFLQQFWQDYDGQPAEVEYNFVDRATIARLHRDFLDDPSETDIITFDLGLAPDNRQVAAVTICPEVASLHAARYNVSLQEEINRLMLHGLLHLLGFNDKNARERRRMRYHERKLLRKLSHYTSC